MTSFFHLPGWALQLARRVLYSWVRTTVLPAQLKDLGLDPEKPVCYVLQDSHLSNLLVLCEESGRANLPAADAPISAIDRSAPHSVIFLNRKNPTTAAAHAHLEHSPLMRTLVQALHKAPEWDIQLIPVVILWGRRPDKQESILKALFSETWRHPGPLRRLLTILLHGRNVLVRFNSPISLRTAAHKGLDEEQVLRKLSRLLHVHFRRQRLMAIGPDLSHRYTQIDALLNATSVRTAIATEASTHNIALASAQLRARRFALEIASDYSYGTLRALELLMSWLWTRLYDSIEIHNVDTVTQIAQGHGIVYVPTHRSHIDYLLLSYSLYKQGLTPPHIAAGANLNIFLIGPLLRRCGAFFLRRSFKGKPLYAAVFNEYLHLMITRGFPLEYFIEGGRSRSGRTLPPKAGILGMTIRSFISEHSHPLVFVPVYIGYEKIMEGRTYLRELAGKPKQTESLWGVLRNIRRIKKVFGKVYINFGKPLALAHFLDDYRPGWNSEAGDSAKDWSREATFSVATELVTRLNEAAVINPINLLALALLSSPRHTADEHALNRQLEHYQVLLANIPYSSTTILCNLSAPQIVDYAIRFGVAERITHPLGDLIRLNQFKAPLLAYFRNNILHIFALPALIACLLNNTRHLGMHRIIEAVSGIYGLVRIELFLNLQQDELQGATTDFIDRFIERGLLQREDDGQLSAPEPNSLEFTELRQLGECIRPILERQFLTLALLQHEGSGYRTRDALESDCLLIAQRLSLLSAYDATEFAEKSTFSALITHLIDSGLLREDDAGLLHYDHRINIPLAHAELLLAAETRQTIRRMACAVVPAQPSPTD